MPGGACASCGDPIDAGADCPWCASIATVTRRRDAALPQHQALIAGRERALARSSRGNDLGGGLSTVAVLRIAAVVFLAMLKLCTMH
jgi:hypothetical protein